jgi:dihydroorotate dehydrogenase (fumarate)
MSLRTTYMGLELRSPIVASASPICASVDNICRMEENGAAAVVMFSLFEEQLKQEAEALERLMHDGEDSSSEASGSVPATAQSYSMGSNQYLDILHEASQKVSIPVMGSLNGVSHEGWVDVARRMQDAGAAGIELNVYYIPADIHLAGLGVEQQHIDILRAVKDVVSVPVALKLSPFFSSIGNACHQFDEVGADALVLFNRLYQPDFDLETLDVIPNLRLSQPFDTRLPLMWIAVLFERVNASLAATIGVH